MVRVHTLQLQFPRLHERCHLVSTIGSISTYLLSFDLIRHSPQKFVHANLNLRSTGKTSGRVWHLSSHALHALLTSTTAPPPPPPTSTKTEYLIGSNHHITQRISCATCHKIVPHPRRVFPCEQDHVPQEHLDQQHPSDHHPGHHPVPHRITPSADHRLSTPLSPNLPNSPTQWRTWKPI
jgi:hypothetical protein